MKRLVLSLIVATLFGITSAQRTIYEQYIDKYKHAAVEQMHKIWGYLPVSHWRKDC